MTWGWDLHTVDVVVIRVVEGKPDADGRPTRTETKQLHAGCNVQPAGSVESAGEVHVVTSRWRVSGPPADWILAGDSVEVPTLTETLPDGTTKRLRLSVDGRPQTYLAGPLPHTEYFLIERRA